MPSQFKGRSSEEYIRANSKCPVVKPVPKRPAPQEPPRVTPRENRQARSRSLQQGRPPPQLEFSKGGKVKQTGNAKVHKGEVVIPASLAKKMIKLFK